MSKRVIAKLALAALLCLSQQISAAGFSIFEQSASGLGNAFAGAAAIAEDATTVYFNPAGMSKLCRQEVVAVGSGIFPSAKFHNKGSILTPAVGNGPLLGGNGRNAGSNAFVGSFYYVKPWRCGLTFGIAVNAPFGLTTNYGDDWVGRYHASYSKLVSININPSISYRFNDCFSIGAGFTALYAHADLRNAIDFGSILFASSGGLAGVPQQQDGKGKVRGGGWRYGGNVGILWDVTHCTRIGLHYRSQIEQKLKGTLRIKDIPVLLQPGFSTKSDATAHLPLPDMISLSAIHKFRNCWTVLGDITWTRWSTLKRLKINFSDPVQASGPAITTLHWENTLRYSLGVNYNRPCCPWIFRAGLAYDETPIPNKKRRTPRIPDQDRVWTAIGCGYNVTQNLHFDLGYAHLFVKRPKVDKTSFVTDPTSEDFFRGGLRGHWNAGVDIVSLQAVYRF